MSNENYDFEKDLKELEKKADKIDKFTMEQLLEFTENIKVIMDHKALKEQPYTPIEKSKMEALNNKIDYLIKNLESKLVILDAKTNNRFDVVDKSIISKHDFVMKATHERFDSLDEYVDERFNVINNRFDALNESIHARFEATFKRLDKLENI